MRIAGFLWLLLIFLGLVHCLESLLLVGRIRWDYFMHFGHSHHDPLHQIDPNLSPALARISVIHWIDFGNLEFLFDQSLCNFHALQFELPDEGKHQQPIFCLNRILHQPPIPIFPHICDCLLVVTQLLLVVVIIYYWCCFFWAFLIDAFFFKFSRLIRQLPLEFCFVGCWNIAQRSWMLVLFMQSGEGLTSTWFFVTRRNASINHQFFVFFFSCLRPIHFSVFLFLPSLL